jgi:hypothetical protein
MQTMKARMDQGRTAVDELVIEEEVLLRSQEALLPNEIRGRPAGSALSCGYS